MDDVVEDYHIECDGLCDATHSNCFGDREGLDTIVLDEDEKGIFHLSLGQLCEADDL